MIDQIIHSRLRPLGRAEVDPVRLAHVLDLLPRPRQPHERRVEFFQVCFQHRGRVAGWIAGDEEGEDGGTGDGRV